MIPISLIPIYWIFEGKYIFYKNIEEGKSKYFKYLTIGIIISILSAISDGYYSFFFLLLLGFASLYRIVNFDYFTPKNLLAPLVMIILTISTTLAVTAPIREHHSNFPLEAKQDEMKSPVDAEVYSPTLKLLITPVHNHRIGFIDDIGRKVVDTANFNRRFPYKVGAPVVLGTFGSMLLFGSFILILMSKRVLSMADDSNLKYRYLSTTYTSALLSLFILLCSIIGGVGSLIALVFPTIRAYERFPIFLYLILYLGFGSLVSSYISENISSKKRVFLLLLTVITTVFVIFDQTQYDQLGLRNEVDYKSRTERFLAERKLIAQVEKILPEKAMVYQYPFSQFLSNNKHYGWGMFGQVRAYLHSKKIRWSNGAAKGSYIDTWHEKKSVLPIDMLIPEMQAVGFEGVLVDKLVLKENEYELLKKKIKKITGNIPIIDNENKAKMAFWKLPKLPFILQYDEKYQEASKIKIFKKFDIDSVVLPKIVNSIELNKILSQYAGDYPFEIDAKKHPELFFKSESIEKGFGWTKINNDELHGEIKCNYNQDEKSIDLYSELVISIQNKGSFDWRFDEGIYPLRIGFVFTDADGNFLKDGKFEVNKYLKSQDSIKIKTNISEIVNGSTEKLTNHFFVSIKFLQEGNRWFEKENGQSSLLEVVQ
jgi:hypothetical protein